MFSQACVKNSVHRGGGVVGGHALWEVCIAGGMHGRGCAWQGACMEGGHAWQGGVHSRGGMRALRDGHCSRCYASYWNAFLL